VRQHAAIHTGILGRGVKLPQVTEEGQDDLQQDPQLVILHLSPRPVQLGDRRGIGVQMSKGALVDVARERTDQLRTLIDDDVE